MMSDTIGIILFITPLIGLSAERRQNYERELPGRLAALGLAAVNALRDSG